ncbi:MAG TPA: rRNA maturation RNase YbeY [Patescibacteria group bacterium]|jgi:probable rRNA maturation factor|nr:rRNA maturation RNase YbeY [Patescibacteria group bacterium]
MTGPFETTVVLRTATPPLRPDDARRLMSALARRLLVPHGSVAVVFADDEMLRDLNRRYRGKDRSTDVLSFPTDEPEHLGDIVVSSETTRRQGRRRRHGARHEAKILLIHGFLHLLGYDHEVDDGEMEALERTLREEMIER